MSSNSVYALLADSENHPDKFEELYKRWFDNMKEYMAKKEERLAKKVKAE